MESTYPYSAYPDVVADDAAPPAALPPPTLNGGLYTGEPFLPEAPWRNFPATPDAGYMTHVNLLAGGNAPPSQATYHIPGGGLRPGNNTPVLPVDMVGGRRASHLNIVCVPDSASLGGGRGGGGAGGAGGGGGGLRQRQGCAADFNHGFGGWAYLDG